MKRLITAMISVVALFSLNTFATNIGVVDMQQIFQQSPAVKKINEDLTKQFASRRDDLIKMSKDFQNDVQQYQKNQAVMSSKDADDAKNKLATEEDQMRQAQAKFQQDLFAAQDAQMKNFMSQIKTITQKVAADKKLDIVLPKNSVLYAGDSMDITSQVLDQLK